MNILVTSLSDCDVLLGSYLLSERLVDEVEPNIFRAEKYHFLHTEILRVE